MQGGLFGRGSMNRIPQSKGPSAKTIGQLLKTTITTFSIHGNPLYPIVRYFGPLGRESITFCAADAARLFIDECGTQTLGNMACHS